MEADRERHIISRRKFLAAVAASASSLALVACGGGTGTTPSAATTASAESIDAGAEATAAPVAEEAPAEEVPAEPAPEPTVGIAELGTGSQKLVYWARSRRRGRRHPGHDAPAVCLRKSGYFDQFGNV